MNDSAHGGGAAVGDRRWTPSAAPDLFAASAHAMRGARGERTLWQPVWVLELVTAGRIEMTVAGEPWRGMARGEGVLFAPGTPYRERTPAPDDACDSLCLFFDPGDGAPAAGWRGLEPPYRWIDDGLGRLLPSAEEIRRHLNTTDAGALIAYGHFLRVLGDLAAGGSDGDRWIVGRDRPEAGIAARVQAYLRAHLEEAITLADIAAHLRISESGLAHGYKRAAGEAPMATLRRMRVEAAKQHLYDRRLTLEAIAGRTGFADAFHLSRTFKRVTGLSPSAFRRRLEGAEPASAPEAGHPDEG